MTDASWSEDVKADMNERCEVVIGLKALPPDEVPEDAKQRTAVGALVITADGSGLAVEVGSDDDGRAFAIARQYDPAGRQMAPKVVATAIEAMIVPKEEVR